MIEFTLKLENTVSWAIIELFFEYITAFFSGELDSSQGSCNSLNISNFIFRSKKKNLKPKRKPTNFLGRRENKKDRVVHKNISQGCNLIKRSGKSQASPKHKSDVWDHTSLYERVEF